MDQQRPQTPVEQYKAELRAKIEARRAELLSTPKRRAGLSMRAGEINAYTFILTIMED